MAERFVIIGAGPAGMRAAEVLRQKVPAAEITLIGDEAHPPYDRPPLSKAFLTEGLAAERLALKPPGFYAEQRITLKLGVPALAIDRARRDVVLAGGERVAYDKLLLATGCRGRELPEALAGAPVHYLRSLADAEAIRAALKPGLELVLIGGGFIGLEIAASATKLGARVTVLEMAPRLMSRGVPAEVSDFARALHERHGVEFELGARLRGVARGADGRLLVETERQGYPADLVVAGIGAAPNTALAEAAGLAVEDGIRVDAQGRTSDPDVFAAGDVTRHENPLLGRAIRVESWQVALNQAAAVAAAMAGGSEAYAELPWLWTDQYDCNIQVLGVFDTGLDVALRRDPAAGGGFTLLGLDGEGCIAAAITVNTGRDMAVLRRLVPLRARFPRERLVDPAQKLSDLLKAARSA
ncbi:MAG TPA: FAD-dependent oxidoreductase [Stellaceae bacterium]|nr:FAD-dependent oxidoreductase [Stellaceae bacterium]